MSDASIDELRRLREENDALKQRIAWLEQQLATTTQPTPPSSSSSSSHSSCCPSTATSQHSSIDAILQNANGSSQPGAPHDAEPHDASTPDKRAASVASASRWCHGLSPTQIVRYSRQLLLSELGGPDMQRRLLSSRVLIIGAGGLGAPVALYLAAAGIGHLTLVDDDRVELSNLHRQVIHDEERVGWWKAESAAYTCRKLNSDVQVKTVCQRFDETNAIPLMDECDIVVDASDNVATRYLINDAAIVCSKVLVSGSALRLEGQLSVFGLHGGPCYRCLYPSPPPPATVTNCSDGGVLGAITGIIGSMQALEVIKIVAGLVAKDDSFPSIPPLSPDSTQFDPLAAAATCASFNKRLFLFDGCSASVRAVKIRPRNPTCAVCGDHPTITRETLKSRSFDYQHFCASANHDAPNLATGLKMARTVPSASVREVHEAYNQALVKAATTGDHVASVASPPLAPLPLLLDVREPVQYRICALPGAINVPLRVLKRGLPNWLRQLLRGEADGSAPANTHPSSSTDTSSTSPSPSPSPSALPVESVTPHPSAHPSAISPSTLDSRPRDVFVMCRRGIDSVTATRLLLSHLDNCVAASSPSSPSSSTTGHGQAASDAASTHRTAHVSIRNVSGGLQSWVEKVEPDFPLY